MRRLSTVICLTAKARAEVAVRGRPPGTATTTSVTEIAKMCVKSIPFSLVVERKKENQSKDGSEEKNLLFRFLSA